MVMLGFLVIVDEVESELVLKKKREDVFLGVFSFKRSLVRQGVNDIR